MTTLAQRLEHAWARKGVLSFVLLPLALLFGMIAGTRRWLFSRGLLASTRVSRPVIVIGNLTVGGAGKTPLTIAIVDLLRKHGWHPGIVSRGYGGSYARSLGAVAEVTSGDARVFGDETVLMRRRSGVPVMVGARRADAAQALLAAHPDIDVVLCDDGLQHYALARDLELAVFDDRGAGNARLLPAGPLREPLSRLAGVDAVVLNGRDASLPTGAPEVRALRMQIESRDAYRLGHPDERAALTSFAGRRILAAAGMGNPQRFFDTLAAAGLKVDTLPLADHFDFARNPFQSGKAAQADIILITEKDAVKCEIGPVAADPRVWVVPVDVALYSAFTDFLLEKLSAYPQTGSAPA